MKRSLKVVTTVLMSLMLISCSSEDKTDVSQPAWEAEKSDENKMQEKSYVE